MRMLKSVFGAALATVLAIYSGVAISARFEGAPPTLLTQIQSMANERGMPPSRPSSPWLTVATRNITTEGAEIALERSEVAAGSVTKAESIGYFAMESSRSGHFLDQSGSLVEFESQLIPPAIEGWSQGCFLTRFLNHYAGRPLVLAAQSSRHGGDGGWLRRCKLNAQWIGLAVDEDRYRDQERRHTKEAASLIAFSRPFVARMGEGNESWQLQASSVKLPNTSWHPEFKLVTFTEEFSEPPVVLALPTNQGHQPGALRIRNVTSTGFEVVQVEPFSEDGRHNAMEIHYLAVTPGTHYLPDGTRMQVGTLSTDAVQHGGGVTGKTRWESLRFVDDDVTDNQPPVAIAVASPLSGSAPLVVGFDASESFDPDGDINRYRWDFADGSSASGVVVNHTYEEEGRYTATLTVTDNKGLTHAVSLNVQVTPVVIDAGISTTDAARFLTQATFGPRLTEIQQLVDLGSYSAWIDQQLALPPSSHLERMRSETPGAQSPDARVDVWWDMAVHADDQLRQRVAFALSEIMVVSDRPDALVNLGYLAGGFYEVLIQNGLGNFRDLLEQVTLNPAMGIYLSMLGNDKPDLETGRRADENYAREVLQLFSIGLVELNSDGTRQLVNGEPVPTYNQSDIENLARALTGWGYNNGEFGADWEEDLEILVQPMVPYESHHDTDAKVVMGIRFPAGQSAREDLDRALDLIVNHPNVGPFIGRQLIQRLVTSNPSPEYIERVAAAFDDNGSGQRGDLQAVVKAILLDSEARQGQLDQVDTFGKLREPLLRVSHLWRAFNAQGGAAPEWSGETYEAFHFHGADYYFTQSAPLRAASVFNYFSPNYSPPGELKEAGLFGPEFQIDTESRIQFMYSALLPFVEQDGLESVAVARLNLQAEIEMLDSPERLLDHLNLLMMSGAMSDQLRQVLMSYININRAQLDDETLVRQVIALIFTSAEYAVQR